MTQQQSPQQWKKDVISTIEEAKIRYKVTTSQLAFILGIPEATLRDILKSDGITKPENLAILYAAFRDERLNPCSPNKPATKFSPRWTQDRLDVWIQEYTEQIAIIQTRLQQRLEKINSHAITSNHAIQKPGRPQPFPSNSVNAVTEKQWKKALSEVVKEWLERHIHLGYTNAHLAKILGFKNAEHFRTTLNTGEYYTETELYARWFLFTAYSDQPVAEADPTKMPRNAWSPTRYTYWAAQKENSIYARAGEKVNQQVMEYNLSLTRGALIPPLETTIERKKDVPIAVQSASSTKGPLEKLGAMLDALLHSVYGQQGIEGANVTLQNIQQVIREFLGPQYAEGFSHAINAVLSVDGPSIAAVAGRQPKDEQKLLKEASSVLIYYMSDMVTPDQRDEFFERNKEALHKMDIHLRYAIKPRAQREELLKLPRDINLKGKD